MAKRKKRQLPSHKWPPADQAAWTTANAPGGAGAHWGERMRASVRVSYVWWLLHLDSINSLDREAEPLERVTPERVDGFVGMLQRDHSPSTVHHHLSHLAQALRVMVPGAERDWLKAEVCRLQAIAKGPRPLHTRDDPSRRCMRFDEWPLADRSAWSTATSPGGLAASWSRGTRNGVVQGYGRFLGHLERAQRLDRDAGPALRADREMVEDYIRVLQDSCATATVHSYLKKLAKALKMMAPGADLDWLNARVAELAPPKPSLRGKRPEDNPARRCMPLAEWPLPDRQAWDEAISPGDLLLDGGSAADWREGTRKRVIQSYGRFLTYLEVTGHLDPAAPPAERLVSDVVLDYVRHLQRDCATVTVYGYANNLAQAFRVMDPEVDLGWLRRRVQALKARAYPSRNKRARIVPVEQLLELGVALMEEALDQDTSRRRWAVQYRNGLMIALLAFRPFRLRSLALIRIGQHLVATATGYEVRFAEDEVKVGGPQVQHLPEVLAPLIDHYLDEVRPRIAGPDADDHLWLAWKGGGLSDRQIYHQLTTRTAKAFGKKVNPQLFRDCAATSVAVDDPEQIAIVMPLLGHSSLRTSERHYNQARAVDASRTYGSMIRGKRRNIKKARRKPRRPNPEGDPCAP